MEIRDRNFAIEDLTDALGACHRSRGQSVGTKRVNVFTRGRGELDYSANKLIIDIRFIEERIIVKRRAIQNQSRYEGD